MKGDTDNTSFYTQPIHNPIKNSAGFVCRLWQAVSKIYMNMQREYNKK